VRRFVLAYRRAARPIGERSKFINVSEKLVGLNFYVDDGIGLGERKRRSSRKRYQISFILLVLI
jgi:hypothetical protein